MRISSIKNIKSNNSNTGLKNISYNIYIDDDFSFSIPEEEYLRLGLYEKEHITLSELEELKNSILLNKAISEGINHISYKLRTGLEVKDKLLAKGYDENTAEASVAKLINRGYINDREYALKYINEKLKLKLVSRRLIIHELEQKGIRRAIITDSLDKSDYNEEPIIEKIISKKYGKSDLRDEKALNKAYAFLINKGFSYDKVKEVLDRIKAEKD